VNRNRVVVGEDVSTLSDEDAAVDTWRAVSNNNVLLLLLLALLALYAVLAAVVAVAPVWG
jgi:hypothetical protein